MDWDEFCAWRLEQDRRLHEVLFVLYIVCVVVFCAMMVYGLMIGKLASLGGILIMASVGLRIPYEKEMRDGLRVAVVEYRARMAEGPVDEATLSEQTRGALAEVPRDAGQLLQQWIAYGVIAAMLVAVSALILAIADAETVLLIAGVATSVLAALMLLLTVQSFRGWVRARRLVRAER